MALAGHGTPSIRRERALSVRVPKKARVTSLTISPLLLSIVDLTGVRSEDDPDTSLPPIAEDLSMFHPYGSGAECDPIDLRERDCLHDTLPTVDRSTSRDSAAIADVAFSPLICLHSSSISSTGSPDTYCSEGKTPKQVWDFTSPSKVVDDDSSFDTLFRQYLRSPSPANDAASEINGATLVNGALDLTRGTAESDAGPLWVTATEDTPVKEVARDQGDTSRIGNGPRLRLRVSQPKITLRLRLPATGHTEMKKREGGKRKTGRKGTQREKGKKGIKGIKGQKVKKGKR